MWRAYEEDLEDRHGRACPDHLPTHHLCCNVNCSVSSADPRDKPEDDDLAG